MGKDLTEKGKNNFVDKAFPNHFVSSAGEPNEKKQGTKWKEYICNFRNPVLEKFFTKLMWNLRKHKQFKKKNIYMLVYLTSMGNRNSKI